MVLAKRSGLSVVVLMDLLVRFVRNSTVILFFLFFGALLLLFAVFGKVSTGIFFCLALLLLGFIIKIFEHYERVVFARIVFIVGFLFLLLVMLFSTLWFGLFLMIFVLFQSVLYGINSEFKFRLESIFLVYFMSAIFAFVIVVGAIFLLSYVMNPLFSAYLFWVGLGIILVGAMSGSLALTYISKYLFSHYFDMFDYNGFFGLRFLPSFVKKHFLNTGASIRRTLLMKFVFFTVILFVVGAALFLSYVVILVDNEYDALNQIDVEVSRSDMYFWRSAMPNLGYGGDYMVVREYSAQGGRRLIIFGLYDEEPKPEMLYYDCNRLLECASVPYVSDMFVDEYLGSMAWVLLAQKDGMDVLVVLPVLTDDDRLFLLKYAQPSPLVQNSEALDILYANYVTALDAVRDSRIERPRGFIGTLFAYVSGKLHTDRSRIAYTLNVLRTTSEAITFSLPVFTREATFLEAYITNGTPLYSGAHTLDEHYLYLKGNVDRLSAEMFDNAQSVSLQRQDETYYQHLRSNPLVFDNLKNLLESLLLYYPDDVQYLKVTDFRRELDRSYAGAVQSMPTVVDRILLLKYMEMDFARRKAYACRTEACIMALFEMTGDPLFCELGTGSLCYRFLQSLE